MAFGNICKEEVSIIKANGQRFNTAKASVQRDRIYVMDASIPIEPKDLVERKMSNGLSESFEVIDPCFHEGHGGIPAHYQMVVRKLGVEESVRTQSIVYNVTGTNARVNNNSTDQSVNISAPLSDEMRQMVEDLKKAVAALPVSEVSELDRREHLEVVGQIERELQSGAKIPVIRALISSLPNLGNISSIGSFLLQCLAKV